MTLFANTKNGNQEQIKVEGDINMIFAFIESYTGNDLGNDLILQDFVTGFQTTGVVIEAN